MAFPVNLFDIESHMNRPAAGMASGAGPQAGYHQALQRGFGTLLRERLLPAGSLPARGLTAPDYLANPLVRPIRAAGETDAGFRNEEAGAPQPVPSQERVEAEDIRRASLSPETPLPVLADTSRKTTKAAQIEKNIIEAAAKYDLPPDLIRSVIRAESNFDPLAVSRAGARGLMQLMPATAEELGVKDSFDIGQNIDGGSRYLRDMLNRFDGDVKLALSAYNAGPGTVERFGGNVPYRETRLYVQKVMGYSGISA